MPRNFSLNSVPCNTFNSYSCNVILLSVMLLRHDELIYGPHFVTPLLWRMRQGDPEFGAWLGYIGNSNTPNQTKKTGQNKKKITPQQKPFK